MAAIAFSLSQRCVAGDAAFSFGNGMKELKRAAAGRLAPKRPNQRTPQRPRYAISKPDLWALNLAPEEKNEERKGSLFER